MSNVNRVLGDYDTQINHITGVIIEFKDKTAARELWDRLDQFEKDTTDSLNSLSQG